MDLSRRNLQAAERASRSEKGIGKMTAQDSFFDRELPLSHSFLSEISASADSVLIPSALRQISLWFREPSQGGFPG